MTGTTSEPRPTQSATAAGAAQQAVQGTGTQHNYFLAATPAAALPSIAPPFGRRDPRAPVRGRDALVDRLTAVVAGGCGEPAGGVASRVLVVHGLGGVGKTRLALEVAHRAAQRGVEVWWVSAVDPGALAGGMQAVAHALGATAAELARANPADLLWRRLCRRTERWLLVIDDVEEPDAALAPDGRVADETGWLRTPGPSGAVLVTTREGDPRVWGPRAALHRLGELAAADGGQVLRDIAGPAAGEPDEADRLAERLGGLPLALQLAGAYLTSVIETPAALREPTAPATFADYRAALDPSGRAAIAQAWELSLALLERRGIPQARPLLRLLSCFEPAPIPYGLLLHVPTLAASPLFPGLTPARLWQALTALDRLGLVTLARDDRAAPEVADSLTLHPLVRDTNRAHPDVTEHLDDVVPLVTALLLRAIDYDDRDPSDPATWPVWRPLAPHGVGPLRLLQLGRPPAVTTRVAWPATFCAYYHRAAGRYADARRDLVEVLAAETALLGAEHSDALGTRHALAQTLNDLGRLDEAEAEYHALLDACARLLGDEDLRTLKIRHGLADLYATRCRFDEAETEYRAVLAARERILGDEHRETLSARHNLGNVLRDRGRWDEAEAVYRSVRAACARVLGPDHTGTLTAWFNSADIMRVSGRTERAEAALREVLAAHSRVLGDDHPDTLAVRHSLAHAHRAAGRLADAEAQYRATLDGRRRALGEDHPDTRSTLVYLDAVRRDQAASA